jgi:hypothetical protein
MLEFWRYMFHVRIQGDSAYSKYRVHLFQGYPRQRLGVILNEA